MRFQNLTHVHTAGHAQRIEHDLDRRAVGQERHVFHRQNLGDHTLVAVAAGHLVADRDHALGGDVDLDHLQHAAAQLVAALHRVQLAVAVVDGLFDGRPQRACRPSRRRSCAAGCGCRCASSLKRCGLLGDVAGAPDRWTSGLPSSSVSLLLEHRLRSPSTSSPKAAAISLVALRSRPPSSSVSNSLRSSSERLMRRRELLRVDDDAFDARGHFQRIVLHVFAGPAEDRVQQFFFRRQFGLRSSAKPCRPGCRPAGRTCRRARCRSRRDCGAPFR